MEPSPIYQRMGNPMIVDALPDDFGDIAADVFPSHNPVAENQVMTGLPLGKVLQDVVAGLFVFRHRRWEVSGPGRAAR